MSGSAAGFSARGGVGAGVTVGDGLGEGAGVGIGVGTGVVLGVGAGTGVAGAKGDSSIMRDLGVSSGPGVWMVLGVWAIFAGLSSSKTECIFPTFLVAVVGASVTGCRGTGAVAEERSAAAALADSVQHDPATGLLAARLAGRTVPALALQQLGDGTATVQIEGEAMRVAGRLPAAGQSVLLRFPAPAAP